MREKEIEKYLVEQIKKMGGRAYKFVSPGNNGVPDRLVVLPNSTIFFVELKAPGKKPSDLQKAQIGRLRKLGQIVFVIDTKDRVDKVLSLFGG